MSANSVKKAEQLLKGPLVGQTNMLTFDLVPLGPLLPLHVDEKELRIRYVAQDLSLAACDLGVADPTEDCSEIRRCVV